MNADQIVSLVPVVVPAITAIIGLFIPSPGPVVARWSAAWWSRLIQPVVAVWQAKPTQTVVAQEISPATQALINQAVTAAVAAANTPQTPSTGAVQ